MNRTKTVHMICVLKSGKVITDKLRISKDDFTYVNKLKAEIENSFVKEPGDPKRMKLFTFAYTTVNFDDVAAVKIW